MSAIGSYEVLTRSKFAHCLAAARAVQTTMTGSGVFKRKRTTGLEEFRAMWKASLLKEVDFGYSAWALGQYLDAQRAINNRVLFDDESEIAGALAKVFTSAFVFETRMALPDLPGNQLEVYCRQEFAEDGPGVGESIVAAHTFYQLGLMEITPENLVVFVIS